MMCNCPCQQCFPCSWGSIEQYSLWLSNSKTLEQLRMFNGKNTNLLNLFDLLIKATNHIISRVRNLFNFHEVD
nr:hypothetical protein Iba_chr13cCG16560 [Ipomoea batatas]